MLVCFFTLRKIKQRKLLVNADGLDLRSVYVEDKKSE